jgi:hypothetical protein
MEPAIKVITVVKEGVGNRKKQRKSNVRENCRGEFATDNQKKGFTKNINPTGPDGRPLTCKLCGSY